MEGMQRQMIHHLREHEFAQVHRSLRARPARRMARYRDGGEVEFDNTIDSDFRNAFQ